MVIKTQLQRMDPEWGLIAIDTMLIFDVNIDVDTKLNVSQEGLFICKVYLEKFYFVGLKLGKPDLLFENSIQIKALWFLNHLYLNSVHKVTE